MSKHYHFANFKHVDILQKDASYFLAVSEHMNISKAAESLGIQQSGLSRAIQRLEYDLGQKLFQRKNSGLSLTQSGQQFQQAIKDTKRSWEASVNQIFQDAETPSGLIKIGFHASFGQNLFPTIAENLTTLFPQIELEVHTSSSFQVTRSILQGDLDFGLVISDIKNPELVLKKIGEDFLAGYQTSLKELATHLLMNPETQISANVLKKYGLLRKIAMKDYEVMAKTALAGPFIALLPHSVARNYPQLKQVGSQYKKADISLICHKDKLKSKIYKKIFETIIK